LKKYIVLGLIGLVIAIGLYVFVDPLDQNLLYHYNLALKLSERDKGKLIQNLFDTSEPYVSDSDLVVDEFVTGLNLPTTMSFMGNDILVLEKTNGQVRLVRDGKLEESPVLDVNVNSQKERGMLGITHVDSSVYLYFTEALQDGGKPISNNIYKYSWNGEILTDPVLVTVLPAESRSHNGGVMVVGLDGTIYAVIGDQTATDSSIEEYRILQNVPNGELDDTGVIIKVGLNESILKPSQSQNPLEHYFAIGVRNSFGLAIDPHTGNLWDTENGPHDMDEINLVYEKFNSGWVRAMGPATDEQLSQMSTVKGFTYSDPEFTWERPVALTALVFPNSEQFRKYDNSLFVGDCNTGNLYKFTLNDQRTAFIFNDPNLTDLIVNRIDSSDNDSSENTPKIESMDEIIFGQNFGCITDLKFGPDGNLYVTSISNGIIYKIS